MNRHLLFATLAVAALAACTTDVPIGACTTNEDCNDKSICSLELKRCVAKPPVTCDLQCGANETCQLQADDTPKCVSTCDLQCGANETCQLLADGTPKCVGKPCERACGEGFLCQTQADSSEKCLLREGFAGTATLLKPGAGSVAKAELVPVECEVKGPQFRKVTITVTGAGAPTLPEPARKGETDVFATTFDAAGASIEDVEYTFNCELEYGPIGETLKVSAAPTTLSIDTTAPVIAHTANAAWHARSETVTLLADIADSGVTAQGVEPSSVKLKIADQVINGARTTGDTFAFAIVLASVSTATTSGPVSYSIEAADKLGHAATVATSTLKIDAVKPVVTLASDAAWHPRSGGTFNVTAAVTNGGGGSELNIGSIKLSKPDGSGAVPGVRDGVSDSFSFTVDPMAFGAAAAEGPAGWKLVAADAVGNAGETTGTFNIDGKAPSVTITPNTAWTNGSAVVLDVQATDGGHGVNDAEVKVTTAFGTSVCPKIDGVYKCTAGINTPENTVNAAYAVTVNVKDASGNGAVATTTLKVDKEKPTLSFTADGKVYARSGSVIVRAKVADTASGLVGSATPAVVASTGGAAPTVNYDAATGEITITVLTTVAPAGAVTSVNVTVQAFDAVGNAQSLTQSAQFKIDDLPPVISNVTVAYPANAIEPSKLLRRDPANSGRDKATVTARVVDQSGGASVENATVFLKYPKKGGGFEQQAANGTPVSDVFTWTFDANTPEFKLDAGDVTLAFEAKDKVGNAATGTPTGTVAVTRKLWVNSDGPAKINGGVAVTGGKVYFTSAISGTFADNVFALNAATGVKSWSAKVAGTPTTPVSLGQSELFFVYTDAATKGNLVAYPQSPAVPAAPTKSWECLNIGIANGGLAVASWDWGGTSYETVMAATSPGHLWAMRRNVADCKQRQTANVVNSDPRDSSVSVNANRVWFGQKKNQLYTATFNSGNESFELSGATGESGVTTLAGAALKSTGNAVVAPPGLLQEWSAASLANASFTSVLQPVTQTVAPPTLFNDATAYFGTDGGKLFKFAQPTTAPASGYPLAMPADAPVKGSPTIDAAGSVYVVTEDGFVRGFSASGSALWSYDTGSAGVTSSSPALSCGGVLYVSTSNGKVIALISDGGGLVNSSWPRFQHDNRNTGNLATPIYAGTTCQD